MHSHGVSPPPLLRPTGMKLGPPLGHLKHSVLLQGKPETPAREPVLADNSHGVSAPPLLADNGHRVSAPPLPESLYWLIIVTE